MSAKRKSPDEVLACWNDPERYGWHPLGALASASKTRWIIDGVLPASSIVWMAGKPASYKTFIALDMACHVAAGLPWQGRECEKARVIYVAAEGGNAIHVRRAAAELHSGAHGDLLIQQIRPRIDTPEGLAELMSLIQYVTQDRITFELCKAVSKLLHTDNLTDVLKDEYKALHDSFWAWRNLPSGSKAQVELEDKVTKLLRKLSAPYLEGLPADVRDKARQKQLETKDLLEGLDAVESLEIIRIKARQDELCDAGQFDEWLAYKWSSFLSPEQRAAFKYSDWNFGAARDIACLFGNGASHASKAVLLILDTYSQTAADDDKHSVSPYIKNLRELSDQVEKAGWRLTTIVIDHLTKSGDTFMGANAKQGDSDAMIEITRRGSLVEVSCPEKMKDAEPFAPIHLEMVPYPLVGFADGAGRPLTSLVVQDGENTHQLRQAVGSNEDTASAVVLGLLREAGGRAAKNGLRDLFCAHQSNHGKASETVKRAFRRALVNLEDKELVSATDDHVCFPNETSPT